MSRLALVSIGIRRDLIAPLQYFRQLDIVHFYQKSAYDDLTADDVNASQRQYRSPLDLYQKLVAARPDVIQGVEPFSYYTQPYLWAGFLAVRKLGAKLLVVALENRPLDQKFGRVRGALLRFILARYVRRGCLFIALNQGARANLQACGVAAERIERALWGVWGVDTAEFTPRAAHAPDLPPTVLFVGRLHVEKGVFVLLEAFARVRRACPQARLLMVGQGPAQPQLEATRRQLGLEDAVTLMGTIKHRDLAAVFQRADVFCVPSLTTRKWTEQVGAAMLQAMSAGLPVVSTQSGAIPEYVPDGRAGVLVAENDPAALAEVLLDLISNPARAHALGAYGRQYAQAHYAARANVERGEQLVMEHCVARGV